MTSEIAAAHMHADRDLGRASDERLVDRIDIKADERVGLAAGAFDLVADRRVAQKRDCHLVDLHVATSGAGELSDLLAEDEAQVGEEFLSIGVSAAVGKIGAAVEMHS